MLNTQKLLYVLPDLAYVAELLPDKKPYTFAIQSFKQINGEFLNETEFKAENIVKLINKLDEAEEYFLILPDFLFTNTIVSVQETSDAKIKEKLTTETLPKMGLKEETHLIETVVLNQFKGTTRVQLSAIEKSILSVFKVAVAEKDIKITGVAPLSWTVKSMVSLEPSISVLQMGTRLYTAQHYIGVDQTTTATIDQPENIIETIKTLKGAEPSIQTVYLVSNSLLEDKLKGELSKILPIQQMSTKDGSEKIPSYISEIIIASQRTLAIPDFSVPTFKLSKPTAEEKEKYAAVLTAAGSISSETEDEDDVAAEIPKPLISPVPTAEKVEAVEEPEIEETKTEEKLPDIEQAGDVENVVEEKTAIELPDIEDADTEDEKKEETAEAPSILPSAASIAAGASAASGATALAAAASVTPPVIVGDSLTNESIAEAAKTEDMKPTSNEAEVTEDEIATTTPSDTSSTIKESKETTAISEAPEATITPPVVIGAGQIDSPVTETVVASDADQDIDLKQFTQNGETAVESSSTTKPIIKNKSGAKNMMKMILITTGVFILTVAVGIGVGLAILKYSGNGENTAPPVVEVEEPTPTPAVTTTPSPEASASAQVDKAEVTVLIVNATSKAGYAGQIQTKLEGEDFKNVDTGNAKGEYDEADFVYMSEENASLLEALEEASGLDLTATDSAKVEDTQGKYDAVIVLGQ
ncbi:MAG: hypothetical protein QG639_1090 [Patescibacteria group bacterium]|nr:hypothetical protein [Patescibacteria group bacterium]